MTASDERHDMTGRHRRADLAAAFRWAARLDMHEGVANHFSLMTGRGRFVINPANRHFSRIRASDLLELDLAAPPASDQSSASQPSAGQPSDLPDPTAWGLHAGLHRACPHAVCAMHVHSPYATVLACLADPVLPPIDQNSAAFFRRVAVDTHYGGLALEQEGARCARLLDDPAIKVLLLGNHGVLVIGADPAETFDRLYHFERAARTYILALQTGRPLAILSDEVAERTARQIEAYPEQGAGHLAELRAMLDAEGSDYAT
ncbi:class II aldolase/adducin family protein [Profundibacterium mesophilum]|uniref:Glucose-6-phosphate 1-epimerase n=1 Tax=Profundibacterium mesophilum KAUST100406-0324 TaxID=1037889 RepID=A0A921NQ11_9RHOB|nr:class II aldolase/adducin family protein [Profundibacterium mesophilum]KAF0675937.1 glucose-6-phosphate 1-epimerase [Profundibacterium mesophilum KAUST100406-0324]